MAEVTALAGKAARGAGAPPEQAARFGAAAAAHLAAGGDPAVVSRALAALPSGEIMTLPPALDGALASLADGGAGALEHVTRTPLLECYVRQLPFAARLVENADGALSLQVDLTAPRQASAPGRIAGCDALVAQMEALAERTFVPETEASRAAGAGAGLSDND